jgi:hypothetical protein
MPENPEKDKDSKVEIIIVPSPDGETPSISSPIAKAAAAIQILAERQGKTLSEVMEQYSLQATRPLAEMARFYAAQAAASVKLTQDVARFVEMRQMPEIARAAASIAGMGQMLNTVMPEIARQLPTTISPNEKKKIVDELKALEAENAKLRAELDALRQENERKEKHLIDKRKSKRGPHRYSDKDKLKALEDWAELDKNKYPVTLQEWLVERFGDDGGVPKVPKSTFYGWKKALKDPQD